jgi:hypothetical protein
MRINLPIRAGHGFEIAPLTNPVPLAAVRFSYPAARRTRLASDS